MKGTSRTYAIVSIAILGLYLWGFAQQMRVGALPAEVEPGHLAYPVEIGGRRVFSQDELRFAVTALDGGRPVRLRQADGTRNLVTAVPAHGRWFHFVTWITALFFWAIALFVFAPRSGRRPARFFFWATLLYGLAIAVGLVYAPKPPWWPNLLLPAVRILCLALVPTFFVFVSLTFPIEHAVLGRQRLLLPLIGAAGVAVGLWHAGALVAYVLGLPSVDWPFLASAAFATDLQLVVYFLAGVFLFYRSGRRAELEREKKQVKWVLWGVSIGATPFILLWTLPRLLGAPPLVPMELARLLAVATPLAFALAVARHQFLDIDLIIRRSVIYSGLAVLLLVAYLVAGVLVGRWGEQLEAGTARVVTFLSAAGAMALFLATRQPLQRWVDRTFFRIRYDYARAVERLHAELQGLSSQRLVGEALFHSLRRNLQPRGLAVILTSPEGALVSGSAPEPLVRDALSRHDASDSRWPLLTAAPGTTSLTEIESAAFPADYVEAGFLLAQPIYSPPLSTDSRLLGVLLVGPKRSERRYIEQDVQLLHDTALEAGLVLDRLHLVQTVAEEAMARRRRDELDDLKADFLSRVAHDLRTPLTSIRWSTQNLLDQVAGPVSRNQRETLDAVIVATDHLVSLVNNLLEISRLELNSNAIALGPVHVEPVARSVLTALRPIAGNRRIELALTASPHLPQVAGNAETLRQVLFNLVENAIKYSPEGTCVEVRLETNGTREQTISVRDRGAGVAEEEAPYLFERFRQGRASPYTGQQGFGLGLYVVRALIEAMGGQVGVWNHPDGGAVFTCTLRLSPVPQEIEHES